MSARREAQARRARPRAIAPRLHCRAFASTTVRRRP
jgi:hypothetical protein